MIKWIKGKNILLMMLSVAISLVLWLYIVGVENPEGDMEIRDVPITFVGGESVTERNLIIVDGLESKISLRLRGRRSALLSLDKQKDIKVTLNLSDIKTTGQFKHVYDVSVPSGIQVVDKAPYYVNITTDKLAAKLVEVRLKLDGNVAEGYTREAAVLDPAEIKLEGPQNVLDKISHALVVIHKEDMKTSIKDLLSPYVLISHDGDEIFDPQVTANVEEVLVNLPISLYKDVNLIVDVIEGGGLTKNDITLDYSHETIRVSGDPSQLETLNQLPVGSIDLAQVLDSSTLQFKITLPNDVKNLSGIFSVSVTVTIKPGVQKKVLETKRIEIIHIPEGFKVEAITEAVPVTVRGPSELVNDIYTHNIRVVVDLEGVEIMEGQQSFPAKVYLDGYTNVGIVGNDYSVVLNITRD